MERVANINQHFSSRETMGAVCEEEGGGRREGWREGGRGGKRRERERGMEGGRDERREGAMHQLYLHVHVSTMVAY